MDQTEGSIGKKLVIFAVPLILGNLLQQLYNTVDSIIVGNYVGSGGLAAVGSGTMLINLLIAFSTGASTGAGIIVSQAYGAKRNRDVEEAVHTSLAIAGILGAVLTIGGVIMTPQILTWMGTPADVMPEAVSYYKIYSGGLIFNVLYNMAAGILNAVGNSKRSLFYLAAASVTNIVLDLLFVEVFQMGTAGAAVATDISQIVSVVLAVGYLMRTKDSCRIYLKRIRMDKRTAGKIIKLGVPTGIQGMVISLSNLLVQSSVNSFGTIAVAGFGAYLKIDGFNVLPVISLGMAATTFTAQNMGAGKMDRVKKGMAVTLAMGIGYCICIGILLFTFRYQVVGIFNPDAEVIGYGVAAMRYFCPAYFILSIVHSLAGTIRGTGNTVAPMLIMLVSMCMFRMLWIWFVFPHFHVIRAIYMLYPLSWSSGAIMMMLYTVKTFRRYGKKKQMEIADLRQ